MSKSALRNKKKFNWKLPVAVCILLLCGLAASYWWTNAQAQKTIRALTIEDQDLSSLHDGTNTGEYTYRGFTYSVKVTTLNYLIKDVEIVSNRTSKHAKMAEGVVQNVLNKGNVDVDVVAGATITSKVLLKAIEQAIFCNL